MGRKIVDAVVPPTFVGRGERRVARPMLPPTAARPFGGLGARVRHGFRLRGVQP